MPEPIEQGLLSRLSEFVSARTGLNFSPERRKDLERGIRLAAADFGFDDSTACVRWLLSTQLTSAQIGILASHLTIGETYFFRDKEIFRILEREILPDLIRAHAFGRRRLRIWSAGCCTGEEAYSIAMTVGLVPELRQGWDVRILATDINPRFLNKARAGVFGEWSFRGVAPEIRRSYFSEIRPGRFEIQSEIKKFVTFEYLNLADDVHPVLAEEADGMDLVFCRNVLMYWSAAHAARIMHRLAGSAVEGGWLIVGATETSHFLSSELSTVTFRGTTVYRKGSLPKEPEVSAPIVQPPIKFIFPEPVVEKSVAAPAAIEVAPEPDDAIAAGDGILAQARAEAGWGNLEAALHCCEQAIAADKLDANAHYLRGNILQEYGEWEKAASAYDRAIYLRPDFVMAHVGSAHLAQLRGDLKQARRHRKNALSLLKVLGPDDVVPESEGQTAARLQDMLGDQTSAKGDKK